MGNILTIFFSRNFQIDAKHNVEFENMPVLTELTMCHWIKLEENWSGQISYFHFMYSRRSQITSFLGQKDGVIVLTMQILPDTSKSQESQRYQRTK